MSDQRIPLGDAAKLTGKSAAQLLKMVEAGQVKARKTTSSQVRFSRAQLARINPDLLSDKIDVSSRISDGYIRPKRLLSLPLGQHKLGDMANMEATYIRDAEACMGFCRGFGKPEITLTLLGMIDLMHIHVQREGGIPAEPPSYVAGMVGVSQKLMSQTIIPTLIRAGRLKKVTRNGIKVYVFPDDMMRGPKALFRPVDQVPQPQPFDALGFPLPDLSPTLDPLGHHVVKGPVPVGDGITDDTAAIQHMQPVAPTPPAPAPVIEDATPVPDVPSHSAYQILKQAGVDVDNHERGEFFWHRTEHNEVLSRWLKDVPVNEIVVRIDKARIAKKLPANPNSLLAYENIVLGGAA